MIQRIQSVYMALTILFSLLFLKGSFLTFIDKSGSVIKITFQGIFSDTAVKGSELIEKLFPLSLLFILIPIISLVTILFYKRRNIQLWLVRVLIAVVVGLILLAGFYSYLIISKYGAEIIPELKMAIPLLILIFTILAYRGIRKDDRLVKSYDRLRQ